MNITVKLQSQIKTSHRPNSTNNEPLTADMVKQWIEAIPRSATITPLSENRGDFRDSYSVFVGLQASWEETR